MKIEVEERTAEREKRDRLWEAAREGTHNMAALYLLLETAFEFAVSVKRSNVGAFEFLFAVLRNIARSKRQ